MNDFEEGKSYELRGCFAEVWHVQIYVSCNQHAVVKYRSVKVTSFIHSLDKSIPRMHPREDVEDRVRGACRD